jgi:hypothetical protein
VHSRAILALYCLIRHYKRFLIDEASLELLAPEKMQRQLAMATLEELAVRRNLNIVDLAEQAMETGLLSIADDATSPSYLWADIRV